MYMHVTKTAACTQHDVPSQVGPTYGRKMMKGLLYFMGVRASEMRVGESLSRVNPGHHDARRTATARQTNPVPYHADYFGHKLHIDQNEKWSCMGSHTYVQWMVTVG